MRIEDLGPVLVLEYRRVYNPIIGHPCYFWKRWPWMNIGSPDLFELRYSPWGTRCN
jgi:hypothetical protein